MIIYLATNTVNGMQYVGAALDFDKRKRQHLQAAKEGRGSPKSFSRALRDFGEDAFTFEVIDEGSSPKQLAEKEAQWMLRLNTLTPDGYNLVTGGYGPRSRRNTVIKVGEVIYPSFTEAVRQLKPMPLAGAAGGHPKDRPIGPKGVKERIDSGWSVEQAFGLERPPSYRENVKYCKNPNKDWTVAGRTFKSLSHLSDYYNIPLYRLKSRIAGGWELIEAVEIKPRKSYNGLTKSSEGKRTAQAKTIQIGGEFFPSHKAAAAHFGVSYGAFQTRIKNGWTPEQAANIEARPKQELGESRFGMKVQPVTCFGQKFPSINQAVIHFACLNKIKHGTIMDRIMRGWDLERAVSTPAGAAGKHRPIYWRLAELQKGKPHIPASNRQGGD